MKGDGHGDDLGPLLLNHFYVVMEGSFMQNMCIPKKFAETIGGILSETIELEGPSGNTWHVKVTKSNGTFVLQSGWKGFVIANTIDEDDSLVFSYKGDSSFEVQVFDPNGCEKPAPFFAKHVGEPLEESNDSSVGVFSAPNNEVKKEVLSLSSGSETESCSEVSSRSARGRVTGKGISCKPKRRVLVQESSESDEGNRYVMKTVEKKKDPRKKFRSYIVPQKTYLTRAQEETADRMSRQAQKGSDLFVKILTHFNSEADGKCLLNLPSGFACNVLGSKKQVITILPANLDQSKGCTANYYKIGKMRCIRWRKFVHGNGLKEGDLCLFELRKQATRGKLVLTMVIHFGMKRKEPGNSSVRAGAAPHCKVKKESRSLPSGSDTKFYSHISSCSARPLKRKRTDSPEESTDHSDEEKHKTIRKRNDNHSKKTSRPYIVPKKSYLTKAQEEIANRMARKTQKGSELFVRTLTESNIHVALNLPCGFGSEVLGNKKREITLIPAGSKDSSRGYIGNYSRNKHGKQIGYGWPRFVRRNGLKKGDFCLFELRKGMKQGKLDLIIVVHSDY